MITPTYFLLLIFFILFYNHILVISPQLKIMSLFIMEDSIFYSQLNLTKQKMTMEKVKITQETCINDDLIRVELRKMKENYCCQNYCIVQNMKVKQYFIVLAGNYHLYQVIINIKATLGQKISIQFSYIERQTSYFKFNNKYKILEIIKKTEKAMRGISSLYSISVNNHSGKIKIISPIILSQDSNTFLFILRSLFMTDKKDRRTQFQYIKLLNLVQYFDQSDKKQQNQLGDRQKIKEQEGFLRLQKYHQLVMSGNLILSSVQSEKQQKKNEINKIKKIKKIVEKQEKELQPILVNINKIYMGLNRQDCFKIRSQFYYNLLSEDLNYIKLIIAMPVLPKPRCKYDNNMILNYIRLDDAENIRIEKINQGGFSYIYRSEVGFTYVHSQVGHQPLFQAQTSSTSTLDDNHQIRKTVVLKQQQPKDFSSCEEYNRNDHQLAILAKIKLGLSIFLPKYYIPVNLPKHLLKTVMMDFIPFKNLKSFIKSNTQSLSLYSKLYLLFSIVQGLRYISDFKIVHLDLKPTNIMIFCNLLVKLIDFGQSYHPQVCNFRKYKPGFTIPYSSPEIFLNKKVCYTSKSDVFSFGIIMYELLYNKYPYDINNSTESIDQNVEYYLNRWYFAPEENQTYGNKRILRILNSLISRCLSKDPENRPELDWIAIIIRQCTELLY